MRSHGEPARRLVWAFAASWALHGAVVLVVWGSLPGGAESPSRAILELIGPVEAGPATAPSPPRPLPGLPRIAGPTPNARREPPAAVPLAPPPAQIAPAAPDVGDGGWAGELRAPDSVAAESAGTPRPGTGDGAAGMPGAQVTGPRGGYQVIPRYPESARWAGVQGTTLLKVRLLVDGSVGEILLDRSAGHGELDAAAVDAVRQWRFEPARRGGEPVPVWILIPIRFTLG